MSRRTGIATQALFAHASKHARLERYLQQGRRRALTRAVRAAIDTKSRRFLATHNIQHPDYRGINNLKRKFRVTATDTMAIERLSSSAGIPLKYFGARGDSRGVTFQIQRGSKHRLRSAFTPPSLRGHVFTRVSKARLPIRKRFGPGLASLMDRPGIRLEGRRTYFERIERGLRDEERRAEKRAGL